MVQVGPFLPYRVNEIPPQNLKKEMHGSLGLRKSISHFFCYLFDLFIYLFRFIYLFIYLSFTKE